MAYPSREAIRKQFQHMADGDNEAFFKNVSPDVDWTVMGTHPCAGRYHSLQDFQEKTFKRLGAIMQAPGIQLALRNVIGGGDQEWATAELVTNAVCKNGTIHVEQWSSLSDCRQAFNSTTAMLGWFVMTSRVSSSRFAHTSTAGWYEKVSWRMRTRTQRATERQCPE